MKPSGTLVFAPDFIAAGLNIPEAEVIKLFQDGRNIAAVLENNLARELDCVQPEDSCLDYDLLSRHNDRYEVRAITGYGCSLLPPSMHGAGRSVRPLGLTERFQTLTAYIFADVVSFPAVPFWKVPMTIVWDWVKDGKFGTAHRLSRDRLLSLLRNTFFIDAASEKSQTEIQS